MAQPTTVTTKQLSELVIQAAPDLEIVYTDRDLHQWLDHGNEADVAVVDQSAERGKRAFDIAVALGALAASAPLWLVVSVLAVIGRQGPVLYSHPRVGRHGELFNCLKFRTMYPDADKAISEILDANPAMAQQWAEEQKLSRDPRITPLGRVLRRFDLDEIPQFVNVLRGDMSVVGPRPVVPDETGRFGELLPIVLSVRPGLTGLWQVSGRNEMAYDDRVASEARYVRTRSLRQDLAICLRTPLTLVRGNGKR